METKLFYNGKIYLGNKKFAYGFEVKDNIFTKIFIDKKEIDFSKYKSLIDLKKKLVLPSLIDTHSHLLLEARKRNNIDLKGIRDFNKISNIIKAKIDNSKKLICLENLEPNKLLNNVIVNRILLDKINDKIPIFIFSSDLHSCFLNTKALQFLDIFEKGVKSKYGNLIELDNNNLPNGIIREKACQHIRDKIYDFYNLESDFNGLKKVSDELLSLGISSVLTCDIFEQKKDYLTDLYKKFLDDKYGLQIYHQIVFYDFNKLEKYLEEIKNDFIDSKIKDIKIFNDGSLLSKTAFLSHPYLGSNSCGINNYSLSELKQFINIANKYHKQLAIHSIGDKSSSDCIDAIVDDNPLNINRHKLIHFQFFNKDLINKVKKSKILLSIQPSFYEDDFLVINSLANSKLIKSSYYFNKCFDNQKNNISFSSDAPVTSYNPWLNIFYALHGNYKKGIKDNKRAFDIYDAIKCYTENGTYSIFEENKVGKIKKNYLANFIVLNQDIFKLSKYEKLIKTKVIFHYINGKNIYNIDNIHI